MIVAQPKDPFVSGARPLTRVTPLTKMPPLRILTLLLMLMCSGVVGLAQDQGCFLCYYDNKQCRGYFASNSCRVECNNCINDKTPFLESNSSGILLEQRAGKLLVRRVVPNSPAQSSGVQAGDEIISINGRKPGTYVCNSVWSGDDQMAIVELRHAAQRRVLRIPTAPLAAMLQPDNLIFSSAGAHNSFKLDAPFTFGFRWRVHPRFLEISEVLAGSPADGAGLKVGDKILSWDQVTPTKSGAEDVSPLMDSYTPERVDIQVLDGVAGRRVRLLSRGIAEILASPEQGKPMPQMQRASLDDPAAR